MKETTYGRLKFAFRNLLIRGANSQNFLGAPWVRLILKISPRSKKRAAALWLLSLSPHYFFRDDERYAPEISTDLFLKLENERNDEARRQICEQILQPYLEENYSVLDYGCGPGFLARHVSHHVDRVYACDISPGTIACARIINNAENIDYFVVRKGKKTPVSEESLDLIYSFAVIQHCTDDILRTILDLFYRLLKPGGRGMLHIVVDDEKWRTEDEWRSNDSFMGRVKFRYGLHCFGRSRKTVETMLKESGFVGIECKDLAEICDIDDDIASQNLFVFFKPAG